MKKIRASILVLILSFTVIIPIFNANPVQNADNTLYGLNPKNIEKYEFISRYQVEKDEAEPQFQDPFFHMASNAEPQKNWTWLFYNDADFYRAYDPLVDFSEEAYSSENMNVLVLQDQEYSPATLWYIDEDHQTILLEDMGEINMGSYQTLFNFIDYAKQQYPADRYILSFYNHGGGWMGVCIDNTDNDMLTMDELQNAITEAGGVDLTLFTAPCLMGALESVYELRDCVDVYIGSEEGSGYGHWFGTIQEICDIIVENPEISTDDLGDQIIQSIWEKTAWQDIVTMSAVRTDYMDELAEVLDDVAGDFLSLYDDGVYDLFFEIYKSVQSFGYGSCIDTYHFAEQFKNTSFHESMNLKLEEIMVQINNTVIAECNGDQYPNAHGLSIYLPNLLQYLYDSNYGDSSYGLDFSMNTCWDEFVKQYLTAPIDSDVDQYQTNYSTATAMLVCQYYNWTQSFVPIKDHISKVELKIKRNGDVSANLKLTLRQDKDGEDLTTATISYDQVPDASFDWVGFDVTDVTMHPGQTYYLILSTKEDNIKNCYSWAGCKDPESYPNGDVWIQYTDSGNWKIWDPPLDTCFMTYFSLGVIDPLKIVGPSTIKKQSSVEYSFEINGIEDDDVYYFIDWGDNADTGWIGPYAPSEKIFMKHSWNSSGSYQIKAKARNSEDIESNWSYLQVTAQKNKQTCGFFYYILEQLINNFPWIINCQLFHN